MNFRTSAYKKSYCAAARERGGTRENECWTWKRLASNNEPPSHRRLLVPINLGVNWLKEEWEPINRVIGFQDSIQGGVRRLPLCLHPLPSLSFGRVKNKREESRESSTCMYNELGTRYNYYYYAFYYYIYILLPRSLLAAAARKRVPQLT
jgi:hypothetical protein